jgi:heptosyltransferase-2
MEEIGGDETRMSERTLVVMPNWVGDCVMAAPVVAALAASGRSVTLLARKPLPPLLALFPGAAETIVRGEDADTVRRLAAERFAEAAVLPNSFRSARLVANAGIPRRFGYRGNFRSPLLSPAVRRPRSSRPQVTHFRELLAAMNVAEPATWVPRLDLPPELLARGRERLERAHLAGGEGPLVALSPGAEWGPSKRWPMQRWADLAIDLRRRVPGVRAAIFAGPKEIWLGVRVHEESGKLHPLLGPDLDLPGLAAVIAHFDLFVTNDSGPMHLAAALGVRCVAIFGPTDRRRTAPAGEGHVVLDRDLWCAPCFRKRCPLVYHGCMNGIGVREVAEACEKALLA